jgi:hypothetical protein
MGASVLLVNDDCPNVKNAFLFHDVMVVTKMRFAAVALFPCVALRP